MQHIGRVSARSRALSAAWCCVTWRRPAVPRCVFAWEEEEGGSWSGQLGSRLQEHQAGRGVGAPGLQNWAEPPGLRLTTQQAFRDGEGEEEEVTVAGQAGVGLNPVMFASLVCLPTCPAGQGHLPPPPSYLPESQRSSSSSFITCITPVVFLTVTGKQKDDLFCECVMFYNRGTPASVLSSVCDDSQMCH